MSRVARGLVACVALAGLAAACGARSGVDAGAGGARAAAASTVLSAEAANASTARASSSAFASSATGGGSLVGSSSSSGGFGGGGGAPVALCKPGDAPVVVAKAPSAHGLAVDAANVFVSSLQNDEIGVAPKAGGAYTALATDAIGPWYIALDAMNVYWASACSVASCGLFSMPKSGGSPMQIAPVVSPFAIALDDMTIFYTHTGQGPEGVASVAKTGGPATELAPNLAHPVGLAIDDAYVYWAAEDDGTVARVPKSGGAIEVLAMTDVGVWPIAVDAQRVFFATYILGGSVATAPKEGGPTTVLLDSVDEPISIALDDQTVFVAIEGMSDDGQIVAVPKTGGAARVIASGEPSPQAVAVDDSCVYWARLDGTILRAPK